MVDIAQLIIKQFIVVPAQSLLDGQDVVKQFFILTFGTLSPSRSTVAPRVLSAFMAFSSLGISKHPELSHFISAAKPYDRQETSL